MLHFSSLTEMYHLSVTGTDRMNFIVTELLTSEGQWSSTSNVSYMT